MFGKERLQHISSYAGKLLRQKFGRGPDQIFAYAGDRFLILYIQHFLSPMEEVLLRQGHEDTVDVARTKIVSTLLEELRGVIQVTLERDVVHCYHDWNYSSNHGMMAAVFHQEIAPPLEAPAMVEGAGQGALELEVARISSLVQKVPERIETYRLHPDVYVIIRTGILITLEKALIKKGFEAELLVTKDELEKTYFRRDGSLQELFGREMKDIFVDWLLKEDQSLMCIVLK
ncbi:Na-translocating system protein MpsC family protein [Paenibacillus sp. GD4]|uniref:Na-translocating system protein MpsC family protein n=1 Tax=Paenibacillus sp. GD4 TaxID=3068890 RepID=UPI002796D673|nr:Na-translocating system protein MpsC family protein [Paenibacillus sp. GD4]MDQ1911472.1 Na-translocating system protein MpsC family protein [Paenibacillus sp. GD4]